MVSRIKSTGPKSQAKEVKRQSRAYRPLTRKEKDFKKSYESYRRRRKCLGNKGFELKTLCKARVFVLVKDEHGERSHYWSSEGLSDTWPPNGMSLACDSNARLIPLKNEDPELPQTRTKTVPRKKDTQTQHLLHESSDEAKAPHTDGSADSCRTDMAHPAAVSRSAQVKAFLNRFHSFSSQQAAMWRHVRATVGRLE